MVVRPPAEFAECARRPFRCSLHGEELTASITYVEGLSTCSLGNARWSAREELVKAPSAQITRNCIYAANQPLRESRVLLQTRLWVMKGAQPRRPLPDLYADALTLPMRGLRAARRTLSWSRRLRRRAARPAGKEKGGPAHRAPPKPVLEARLKEK